MKLTEPLPKGIPDKAEPFDCTSREAIKLEVPQRQINSPFLEVLEARESNRIATELPLPILSEFLWYGARSKSTEIGRAGLITAHRASPSAGGLHPIEILIVEPSLGRISRYDPLRHSLQIIDTKFAALADYLKTISDAIPGNRGTILQFIGNAALTEAAYNNSESLLWRDCGCLISILALCATALDLSFCPAGVLGTAIIEPLGLGKHWLPCGAALIGLKV